MALAASNAFCASVISSALAGVDKNNGTVVNINAIKNLRILILGFS